MLHTTPVAEPVIIAGIDPGSAVTGYGVIAIEGNTPRWRDSGVIRVPAKLELAPRLGYIFERLAGILAQHRPALVCVEEAFYAKNVRTTLVLGHARGVALLAAQQAGARVAEYSPREIKKALVGTGAAAKEQVAYMVKFMLSPPCHHDQSDAYDALAAALCGSVARQSADRIGPIAQAAGVRGHRRGARR